MRLWSAELSPRIVFDRIGKNATIHDQMGSDRLMSPTQMMISGAIATTGVTCRITAYGNSDFSSHFDCVKTIASDTPTTIAAINAANVMRSVMSSEAESVPQSFQSVCAIRSGPGRM